MNLIEDVVIDDVQLEGFQIVRSIYFAHTGMPTMSIWPTSMQFNMVAYDALNACESVQILVNIEQRKIAVQPIPSKDPDAVGWLKGVDSRKPARITCGLFAARLFEKWQWNTNWRYRANGRLVKCEKKLMLMFDFTTPEIFDKERVVRVDA